MSTYSLVNMPVLGFDLCRLAGGSEVAGILLRVLALDEHALVELAATPRPPARRPAPVPALAGALRGLRDDAGVPAGSLASPDAVRTLERSMIGDFDALVRLVRDDLLAWTWQETGPVRWQSPDATAAVAVLVDELAEVYGRTSDPEHDQASANPGQLDLGPHGAQVHRLIERVTTMTPAQAQRLREAAVGRSPRTQWAAAVHDASWAVYLTGRLRPTAAAQLLAVQAFARGGLSAQDAAYGAWNVISGAVQATAVADLLPRETLDLLTRACDEALGADPLDRN